MTALRSFSILVLMLIVMMGIGIAGCKIMGVDAHVHVMVRASAMALSAATVAVMPALWQQKRTDTAGMFQAALIGSVLHLGIILALAAMMIMTKRATTPFVLWLLSAYWATLIGLCFVFAKLIHAAPKVAKTGN